MITTLRLCVVTTLLCLCASVTNAQTYYVYAEKDGVKFITTHSNSSTATELGVFIDDNCGQPNISIPAEYDGRPVTTFHGCADTNVESITFPASICELKADIEKSYGSEVYYSLNECPKLKSVDLSMTTISEIPVTFTSSRTPESSGYFDPSTTDIKLPSTLKHIGGYTFFDNKLTTIALPDGLETIGYYAFSHCSNLTSISIPSTIKSIGRGALSDCPSLYELRIEKADKSNWEQSGIFDNERYKLTTFVKKLFLGTCLYDNLAEFPELEELEIGKNCTEIPSNFNCRIYPREDPKIYAPKLKRVIFNEGLREIGSEAFAHSSITEPVRLPSTLEKLGEKAFSNSKQLTGVEICGNIPDFGTSTFEGCYAINSIILSDELTHIPYGTFKDTGVPTLTIPTAMTEIESLPQISSDLTIPGNVEKISGTIVKGKLSFLYGEKPLQIYGEFYYPDFPGTEFQNEMTVYLDRACVKTDEGSYYSNIINCKSIELGKGATILGVRIKASESINVPSIEQWLGYDFGSTSFKPDCANLLVNGQTMRRLVIPEGITRINDRALSGIEPLLTVTLPKTIESVGNEVFKWDSGLQRICFQNLESLLRTDRDGTFTRTDKKINNTVYEMHAKIYVGETPLEDITSINIPESITHIGSYALAKSNVQNVTFHPGIKSIGDHAFYMSPLSGNVVLPDGIEEIGRAAFSGTKPHSINVPSGVTEIKEGAFSIVPSDNDIGYVIMHDNITRIDNYGVSGAWCDWNNTPDCSVELVLPSKLKYMGDYVMGAFINKKIRRVVMPPALDSIGEGNYNSIRWHEYRNCEIDINNISNWCQIKLGNYYSNPFYQTGTLSVNGIVPTSIVIPDDVEEITDNIFIGCTSLRNVRFGSQKVGHQAFWNSDIEKVCFDSPELMNASIFPSSLKEIYCTSPVPPQAIERAFYNYDDKVTLYVPVGSRNAYENGEPWWRFINIVEHDMSDISTIFPDETGVEDIAVPSRNWSVKAADGYISVTGADAGSSVQVFNASGMMLYNGDADKRIAVAPGMYMVRLSDGTSAKILAK